MRWLTRGSARPVCGRAICPRNIIILLLNAFDSRPRFSTLPLLGQSRKEGKERIDRAYNFLGAEAQVVEGRIRPA